MPAQSKMKMKMKILLSFGFCSLVAAGCQSQSGGQALNISGPANDTLLWTAAVLPPGIGPLNNPCCPTCKNVGTVQINSAGSPVEVTGVEDDAAYTVVDTTPSVAACMGFNQQQECGSNTVPLQLQCSLLPVGAPAGTIDVSGFVGSMQIQIPPKSPPHFMTVWNTGSVSLTMDGQTITVPVNVGMTAAQVVQGLTVAFDRNSTLFSNLIAGNEGTRLVIRARNAGSQYNYSWQTSCTYNTQYFSSCAMTVVLAPTGQITAPSN